jgi:hypothetical protein
MDLPVAAAAIVVTGRIPLARIPGFSGGKVSWGSIVRPAAIGVWRWRVVSAVGVVVAPARGRVVIDRASRRGPVASSAFIVVITTGTAITVIVTLSSRAIAARRGATTVVVIHGWGVRAATARHGGTGPSSWRGHLSLSVCDTLDALLLKLAAIQLLHSRLQISGSLEFNKAFAAGIARSLRVHHVKA